MHLLNKRKHGTSNSVFSYFNFRLRYFVLKRRLLCKAGTLDAEKVKGRIIVCLRGDNARVDKGEQAALAGAVGMVLANNQISGNEILADPHVLPASHINYTDGLALFSYINHHSTRSFILEPNSKQIPLSFDT